MKKIHHDIEFMLLRKQLDRVSNMEERVYLLEKLVALNPRNPKNLTLRRKYRNEIETLRLKKGMKRRSAGSPYDGIHHKRQVVLLGETNTGKSTLLNALTGARTPVQESPFTTYHPEVHIITCKDVAIQVVEVPALYEGDSDAAKYRFIRNSDVLCVCSKTRQDLNVTMQQLVAYLVTLVDRPRLDDVTHKQRASDEPIEKPGFIASWGQAEEQEGLEIIGISDFDTISEKIYSLLNIKRIFCIRDGKTQENPPVFPADREVTVSEFIAAIDKRLLPGFRRARVVHADADAPLIQAAGLDYVLADGDTVEIFSP